MIPLWSLCDPIRILLWSYYDRITIVTPQWRRKTEYLEHHLDTHLTTIPKTDPITIVYADTTPDQTAQIHVRMDTEKKKNIWSYYDPLMILL